MSARVVGAGSASTPTLSRRADFPLLVRAADLHYLDSAATAQKPAAVLDAEREMYETAYANPHRGAYALSAAATAAYAQARERVAAFVGVSDPATLIFTRGTTESINVVAGAWGRANVNAGDEIVVTGMEHHANFVPWQQLAIERGARFRVCELTADGRVDLDCLGGLLNARTRIFAITHVSNALGTINPVREIAQLVRERSGAIVVCDGAQGVPHLPVRFDDLGIDFYAFSGHKLGATTGIGALLGRRELLEAMPPWQFGGDMISIVDDERSTWNVLPHKFEAGTPNLGGAVAMAAAVKYLSAIGMDAVRTHERELIQLACRELSAIEGVQVLGPAGADALDARSGAISFTVDGIHPHDLATILDEGNVCVRAGHHCCQPLMRRLGIAATTRASFWVYSDEADVAALTEGVRNAMAVFGAATTLG